VIVYFVRVKGTRMCEINLGDKESTEHKL